MASYLGDYHGAATNREYKFRRAVDSFLSQGHAEKKLIIIADGCQRTVDIINDYSNEAKALITVRHIDKQPLFSGHVRNAGIDIVDAAGGGIICYLDTDDLIYGSHLADIARAFEQDNYLDWLFYNDHVARSPDLSQTMMRGNMVAPGMIGSSSIAHKSQMGIRWGNGYGHDWAFAQTLFNRSSNHKQITANGYLACHVPGLADY